MGEGEEHRIDRGEGKGRGRQWEKKRREEEKRHREEKTKGKGAGGRGKWRCLLFFSDGVKSSLLPGEVATVVVGAVTELKSDKLKREAMYLLRQTPLVRWLIGAAACGSPRQEAKPHEPQGGHKARRVLADLLADGGYLRHVIAVLPFDPLVTCVRAGLRQKR